MLSQPRVASFDQSLVISAAALDMWAARSGGNTTQETATHSGNEYITKKEKNKKKQVQDDGFLVIKFIMTVSLARNHYENNPFLSFYHHSLGRRLGKHSSSANSWMASCQLLPAWGTGHNDTTQRMTMKFGPQMELLPGYPIKQKKT